MPRSQKPKTSGRNVTTIAMTQKGRGSNRTPRATVADLCSAMERIAPTWAAEDWDNVGLLAGDPAWPAGRVLLTIDMTGPVLDEARRGRFDAIVSYHPPIFRPVKRMVADRKDHAGVAVEALASRIAVYSPHTALDAAIGGTNDTLAELCGLRDVVPFDFATGAHAGDAASGQTCKLVVFVPVAQVDHVADAAFEAGAGRIGNYEMCSYRLLGEGTFFGTDATDPVVGRKGRLERVEEVRLEVIFPRQRLADVTAAVRRAHPYEEPAFDVYPLQPVPNGRIGQGRIGSFEKPVTLQSLARRLARKTGAANVVTVPSKSPRPWPGGGCASGDKRLARKENRLETSRLAKPGVLVRGFVCVGAAGSMPFEIAGRPCGPGDVVITGEIRHHDALRYQRYGAAAIALGHWASERPVLKPLAAKLMGVLPGAKAIVSQADRDPFGSARSV